MTPRWLNRREYPFVVHTHDTSEGRLSYVDEGPPRGRISTGSSARATSSGPTLLFVHGNATWSYLYRHLIYDLAHDHRCVAFDHLGFGLSDKRAGVDYSPQGHARRLGEFVDALGLDDVILVAHDFGGPIGLAWALDHPERVRGLALFNTWMWSLSERRLARRLSDLYGSWWNRWYYGWLPAGPKFFLPPLVADGHTMERKALEQYLYPFLNRRERFGPYEMATGLVHAGLWFDSLWARREALRDKPAALVWHPKDDLTNAGDLDRWKSALPLAHSLVIEDTRAFVPEEAPALSGAAIRALIERVAYAQIPPPPLF